MILAFGLVFRFRRIAIATCVGLLWVFGGISISGLGCVIDCCVQSFGGLSVFGVCPG